MKTREQLEGVFVVGLCAFLLVGFTWAALVAFGVVAWVTWAGALGIGSLVFGLPFGILAFGKARVVAGLLEGELYRSTGLALDLDGDKRTGSAELLDDDRHDEIAEALKTIIPPAPQQHIRPIPVYNAKSDELPVIETADGKGSIEGAKLRDFIIGCKADGLGFREWKAKGWTRPEWQIARDLLAQQGLASARVQGESGVLIAPVSKCLRDFGLMQPTHPPQGSVSSEND